MKRVLLAAAVLTACSSAAFAQSYPVRVRVHPATPYPLAAPAGLDPDEVADYRADQLDRKQAMERAALRINQKAERRAWGVDDD